QRFSVKSGWLTFVLHMTEHGKQTFLAIDDMFRPGKSIARQKCALGAHTTCPRIDCVFHVGQLAGGDRTRAKCSRGADADSRYRLFRGEIQYATRRNRCSKSA